MPQTNGIMKVTVTRAHNLGSDYVQYIPSRTTCQIGWPEGGEQTSGSEDIIPNSLCITGLTTLTKGDIVIKYGMPRKGELTISVYNTIGSRVWVNNQKCLVPGYFEQKIAIEKMPSGVYFVALTHGTEKVSRKFVLTK